MSTFYDAIFKDILCNNRSAVVESLTGKPRGTPLPTDAGWYTGRSVDYISRISAGEFVHIEVQTGRNTTMHWRMLNYFTLLQHKLCKWKKNDIDIHQFLIYIGPGRFGLDGSHRIVREEFNFKVINLSRTAVTEALSGSRFYGDHIVRLLMKGHSESHWRIMFDAICSMRNDATKLDALFMLHSLAGLRNMRGFIEEEIRNASLYEALKSSPLTKRASGKVAKGEVIETLNRLLLRRGDDELDADQLELLDDDTVSLDDMRQMLDAVMDGATLRDAAEISGLTMKF